MKVPLRLSIISPDPSDNSQGVERFCHSLANSLDPFGIAARVISASDFEPNGADVVLTNVFESVRSPVPRIHVYHGCHIPQIMKSHAESSLSWRAKYMAEAGFREFTAGLGATRVAVSSGCASEVRRWYGHRSKVITNGIDTTTFSAVNMKEARRRLNINENSRAALFIGRPEWRKRPDIAAKAARDHGFEVFLAAGRPFEGMTWLGKLSPEDLALAISAVDVVLMPTQYEACSLALLEAISVGTPVMTTQTGWVPDLLEAVPGYAKFIVPVGDSDAFSEALGKLGEAGEEVTQARDMVRKLNSLQIFGRNWAQVISEVYLKRES